MNKYRIYNTRELPLDDVSGIFIGFGCNSQCHVDMMVQVFYGGDGLVTLARDLGFVHHGLCGGDSCNSDAMGSFSYPMFSQEED